MGPLGQWRDGERGAGERADRWARGAGRRARLREGGRLVRGAVLTWALGERGDAGACAGRAGWAAARSWRVSGSRPARAGPKCGAGRARAGWAGGALGAGRPSGVCAGREEREGAGPSGVFGPRVWMLGCCAPRAGLREEWVWAVGLGWGFGFSFPFYFFPLFYS